MTDDLTPRIWFNNGVIQEHMLVSTRPFAGGTEYVPADALTAAQARIAELEAERDSLPWRTKDIKRGLILFRTSSNAHGFTNYSALSSKIDELPEAAKEELASVMTNMALRYSREDVRANGVIQQWIDEAYEQGRLQGLNEAADIADEFQERIGDEIRALAEQTEVDG